MNDDMPSLIDLMLEGRKIQQHSPWPRAVVDASVWKFAAKRTGARGAGACLASGANRQRCTWRSWMDDAAEIAVVSLDCPDRSYPSVGMHHPPALRLERTVNDLFGLIGRKACPIPAPGSITIAGAFAFRLGDRIDALPKSRRPIASCRWKATACTRSRSVPCMRESSSPDISALPPAARPWSGWSSGSDIPTRASRG